MTLKAENLSKRYMRKTGQANYFYAVRGASLELRPGEVTVLMGRSGSGKTTLLHMLSGLLTPTEGRVLLGDTDLYALGDAALSRLRNRKIAGVVPQGRSAIDSLTVLENVLLPGGCTAAEMKRRPCAGWRRWTSPTWPTPAPRSSPAASCGAWPSPGRWPRDRRRCWPTSPPATWTTRTPNGCSRCSGTRRRSGKAVLIVSHDQLLAV